MSLQSDNINELMAALAKAQGKMSHAVKDSTNPHFKSKYADLASVWNACREPLAEQGLAVTQTMDFSGTRQVLVTTLGHSSGQWMRSLMALPETSKPQEVGSMLSYFRRYSLASMVGVYQDDDDAESAQKVHREPAKEAPTGPKITQAQCAELDDWFTEFPDAKKGICEKFELTSVYDLQAKDFSYVVSVLERRKKNKEKS